MKILFVDAGEQVQEKWVAPLRAEGWGVVRARSIEDATKMMAFHGDTVKGFVVHERFVSFAEKGNLPFVVLTEKWTNQEILKHQNSSKSAVGYLPIKSDFHPILGMFTGRPKVKEAPPSLKEKGRTGMHLVEATGLFSKPEQTGHTASFALKSPGRVLGGGTAAALVREPVAEVPVAKPELVQPELIPSVSFLQDAPEAAEIEPEQPEVSPVDLGLETVAIRSTEELKFASLSDLAEEMKFEDSAEVGGEVLDFEGLTRKAQESEEPVLGAHRKVESSPDLETLKSYLSMREQDVAVLSGQLRSSKERTQQLEGLLKVEKARNAEIQEMLSKAEQRIKNYDLEKQVELEVMQKQVEDMSQHLKDKTEKARVIETKLRLMSEEVNKVKDRVRVDIRRIRVREKELEGQLEILKKDSGALLQARDEKILELKRRIDLLEFNMELVQEQYEKERRASDELKLKLKDAAQAMKQANGFLEQ